ncbi:MAG: hypothetical protein O3B13_24765 [Planctomycetota bacterium]|nr:hypothetical protein [Planctomycetota bacterium]
MSDLNEFLRAATVEAEEQRFQRDHEAGLIPMEELIGRVRLVGNPRAPLAVPYHFRTHQEWMDYYGNRQYDFDSKPEPPPPINGAMPPAP